jgi:tetratricopeptide (TPR) repeat protein
MRVQANRGVAADDIDGKGHELMSEDASSLATGAPEERPDVETCRNHRRPRRWFVAVVILAVGGGAMQVTRWFQHQRGRDLVIPQLNLSDLDPAIVKVMTEARQAVEARSYDADAWGHLGMVLYAHEHNSPAVQCFANAETLDQENFRWPYLRGMILAEENYAKGIEHVRRAASLVPLEDSSVRLRLAELLFDVRELAESEAIFRDVLAVEMDNPRAKYGLARVLALHGDPQEALRWAAGAARTLPPVRATYELLAKLQFRVGNREAAEMQRALVDRLPDKNLMWPDQVLEDVALLRVDARWQIEDALKYRMLGQPQKFVRALRKLVADHPEVPSYYSQLGRAALEAGDVRLVGKTLEEGARRHPDAVEIRFYLGKIHQQNRKFAEAVTSFQEAVTRKPDYPNAWNALAACQMELRQPDPAEESYRQAVRHDPFHLEALIGLGNLLLSEGRGREAEPYLRTALQLIPEDPQITDLLQKAQSG